MPGTESKDEMITKRELWEYRAELKGQLFRALREMLSSLQSSGVNQATIARRLNADPARVSKRLSGKENMTLETISDLARAMECRIDVQLTHFSEMALTKAAHQQADVFSVIETVLMGAETIIPEPDDLKEGVLQMWEFKRHPRVAFGLESELRTDNELLEVNA